MNQRAEDVVQKRHSFALLVVSFLKAMREELHQTMRDPGMSQDDKLLARRNFCFRLQIFTTPVLRFEATPAPATMVPIYVHCTIRMFGV